MDSNCPVYKIERERRIVYEANLQLEANPSAESDGNLECEDALLALRNTLVPPREVLPEGTVRLRLTLPC
jgi:hypothetical protein